MSIIMQYIFNGIFDIYSIQSNYYFFLTNLQLTIIVTCTLWALCMGYG
uniref:Uncharacterized protein n=1 Tax=Anguilla anguilla TaxID=7936 RepID=A0A0E9QZG2_ANGAN